MKIVCWFILYILLKSMGSSVVLNLTNLHYIDTKHLKCILTVKSNFKLFFFQYKYLNILKSRYIDLESKILSTVCLNIKNEMSLSIKQEKIYQRGKKNKINSKGNKYIFLVLSITHLIQINIINNMTYVMQFYFLSMFLDVKCLDICTGKYDNFFCCIDSFVFCIYWFCFSQKKCIDSFEFWITQVWTDTRVSKWWTSFSVVKWIYKNVIDVWHSTFLSPHIHSNTQTPQIQIQETPTDYLRIMFLWNQCRHSTTIKETKYH